MLTLEKKYDILVIIDVVFRMGCFVAAIGSFIRNFFSKATKCGKLINRTRRGAGSYRCAGIAQSVEQLIRNQQVAGSSPVTSSNFSVTEVTEFFDFWYLPMREETM